MTNDERRPYSFASMGETEAGMGGMFGRTLSEADYCELTIRMKPGDEEGDYLLFGVMTRNEVAELTISGSGVTISGAFATKSIVRDEPGGKLVQVTICSKNAIIEKG